MFNYQDPSVSKFLENSLYIIQLMYIINYSHTQFECQGAIFSCDIKEIDRRCQNRRGG